MQHGGGSLGRHANGEAWACAKIRRRGDSGYRGTGKSGGDDPFSLLNGSPALNVKGCPMFGGYEPTDIKKLATFINNSRLMRENLISLDKYI